MNDLIARQSPLNPVHCHLFRYTPHRARVQTSFHCSLSHRLTEILGVLVKLITTGRFNSVLRRLFSVNMEGRIVSIIRSDKQTKVNDQGISQRQKETKCVVQLSVRQLRSVEDQNDLTSTHGYFHLASARRYLRIHYHHVGVFLWDNLLVVTSLDRDSRVFWSN